MFQRAKAGLPPALQRRVSALFAADSGTLRRALKPSESDEDDRDHERTKRVPDVHAFHARLEARQERRKILRRRHPIHDGKRQKDDAEKSGDQRQRSGHHANVRDDRLAAKRQRGARDAAPAR